MASAASVSRVFSLAARTASLNRLGASSRRFRRFAPMHAVKPTIAFQTRSYSDDVSPAPGAEVDPALRKLIDDISGLTLLQVSQLCKALKTELNIADVPTGGMMAPMMAAPAPGGGDGAAEAEDTGPVALTVRLDAFAPDAKIKLIKEVKALMSSADPSFNLAKAKKFVESLPQTMGENMTQDDADALKAKLEAAGGTVVLE